MLKFAEFLQQRNVSQADLSAEELGALRKEYRKVYKRLWQRQAQGKVIRKQLAFSKPLYQFVQKAAAKHGQAFSRFALNAIEAYLKGNYITLDSQESHELKLGLKRLGVNLNQIALRTNQSKQLAYQDLLALKEIFWELEALLHEKLDNPTNLNDLVREALQQHPNYRTVLLEIIEEVAPC